MHDCLHVSTARHTGVHTVTIYLYLFTITHQWHIVIETRVYNYYIRTQFVTNLAYVCAYICFITKIRIGIDCSTTFCSEPVWGQVEYAHTTIDSYTGNYCTPSPPALSVLHSERRGWGGGGPTRPSILRAHWTGGSHIWVNSCWWLSRCWVTEGMESLPAVQEVFGTPSPTAAQILALQEGPCIPSPTLCIVRTYTCKAGCSCFDTHLHTYVLFQL